MVQFITDSQDRALFAVLPIADYERVKHLLNAQSGGDELETFLVTVPKVKPNRSEKAVLANHNLDAPTIPQSVISLMVDGMTPVAAWRIYRNLTQAEAAARLGIGQSAYSKMEARGNKLRSSSREKLAKLFECAPSNFL